MAEGYALVQHGLAPTAACPLGMPVPALQTASVQPEYLVPLMQMVGISSSFAAQVSLRWQPHKARADPRDDEGRGCPVLALHTPPTPVLALQGITAQSAWAQTLTGVEKLWYWNMQDFNGSKVGPCFPRVWGAGGVRSTACALVCTGT